MAACFFVFLLLGRHVNFQPVTKLVGLPLLLTWKSLSTLFVATFVYFHFIYFHCVLFHTYLESFFVLFYMFQTHWFARKLHKFVTEFETEHLWVRLDLMLCKIHLRVVLLFIDMFFFPCLYSVGISLEQSLKINKDFFYLFIFLQCFCM